MQTFKQNPFFHSLQNLVLYIKERKFECLLFSFLWLIFGNTFWFDLRAVGVFGIYQNFIIGLLIFYEKKQLRCYILFIIGITIGLDIFRDDLPFINMRSWHGILYLLFFFLVSKEVYKEVLYTKNVTRELPAAGICGLVLLCLMSTFLFFQIEMKTPNSFTNTGDQRDVLYNLNYFSFTTILTIGYGDIVPVSMIAKRAVMLMGLIGHFYTVFITSIIIGKYLSAKKIGD